MFVNSRNRLWKNAVRPAEIRLGKIKGSWKTRVKWKLIILLPTNDTQIQGGPINLSCLCQSCDFLN